MSCVPQVYEKEIESTFSARKAIDMGPAAKTITEELDEAAKVGHVRGFPHAVRWDNALVRGIWTA